MADLIDSFPLAAENPETIMARLLADVNAGIEPTDPLYVDVLPGTVWDDLNRAMTLELDRVHDRMLTEVPAAALPALTTGVWLDAWADTVGLERKDAIAATGVVRFTGATGTDVATGTQVSTEAPTADADPITFQTTEGGEIGGDGYIDLLVEAVEAGSEGNVAANSVTLLDSPISGVTVSNQNPISGGDDVESDERLQARIVKKLQGANGAGNIDYYENIALNFPGVGFVTVSPNDPSPGFVRVTISDAKNDPVSDAVIDALQAILDPPSAPGQGAGLAPVGAEVTVDTPTPNGVTIAATPEFEAGYSLDGESGTRAIRDQIEAAVARYVDALTLGANVVHNKVLAAIIDVEGVADVSALTLDGDPAADVAIADTEVAVLTSLTLT